MTRRMGNTRPANGDSEPERCEGSDGGEMPHWWMLTDHDGVRYRGRHCIHCNERRTEESR